MRFLLKLYVNSLKKIELGSAISVRLTKITGKSKVNIHPKHFLNQDPWYTKKLSSSDIVLDLGSGIGQSAIKAARVAKKVIGVEKDKQLILIATKSASIEKAKNVSFKKGDLENKLKFKNNSFEKIIFLDVLEHLNSRDQILKEIHRVLKPKGLLFLGVPNSETSWKKLQRKAGTNSFSDPDHKIEFSEKQIKDLLQKHKFKIIEFSYGKVDTPFRGFYDIIGGFSISAYRKISNWRQQKANRQNIDASGFEIVAQK
ncbi:MAG: class I SAM-dependent methyltransferase [Candidatus Curtissbacteria bacterium]|nr:class I SAM-dependent methyltransferase [Candidatus Curtissbacteria bacterium]